MKSSKKRKKEKINPYFKTTIVILGFVIISVVSYILANVYFNPKLVSLKENLSITVGKCSGAGPDIEKINQTSWDNNSLVINTTISPNCSRKRIIGDYEIHENSIVIKYKSEHMLFESGEMACICPTDVIFTIDDIEKKDYDVTIEYDRNL